MAEKKKFNPDEHLVKIKGQQYLPVAWRLVWFREEHPQWGVETRILERGNGWVVVRAVIKDEEGRIRATAHKVELKSRFQDYLEKAETGAIGRALALCGYGTQFSPEFEESERLSDTAQPAGGADTESQSGSKQPITVPQMRKIYALLSSKFGLKFSQEQINKLNELFGLSLEKLTDLSKEEASFIIEDLENMPEPEKVGYGEVVRRSGPAPKSAKNSEPNLNF